MMKEAALVHQFLEISAEKYPEKIAVIHDDVRASYGDINVAANRLARWLVDSGVAKGDRVPMIFLNSLEYIISYYGIMKVGAIAVPLSTDLKPDSFRPLIEELEPVVIIVASRYEKLLQETGLESLTVKNCLIKDPSSDEAIPGCAVTSWDSVMSSGDDSPVDISIEPGDMASFIYTSGSTGKPKGVMLTHANIVTNTNSICEYLKLTEKDIQMVVLPFFYVMGKSLLNTHFAAGGSLVLNNKFAYPATVVKQLVEEKCTGFSGVPSTFAYLLHRSPLRNYRDQLVNLRYCSQAGGHMARQTKEELREALPEHVEIFIMYGATEASARLTYLDPARYHDKMDSIGKAIPGVIMKVVDENGNEVPAGETGELVGAGNNIMQGYWKDPELSAAKLDHNGYHTGDLGYSDDEGFLYLVGRKDNILKVGGHRINPQEIEDVIMETQLIVEVAVVGIPDQLLGNRLVAVAVPIEKDTKEEDVLAITAQKLPKYKLPSEIRFVRQLPKKVNGKIDKFKCKELLTQ